MFEKLFTSHKNKQPGDMGMLSELIDKEGQVCPEYLGRNSLSTVIVYDIFRGIEADWLSEALTNLNVNSVDAICYDDKTVTP